MIRKAAFARTSFSALPRPATQVACTHVGREESVLSYCDRHPRELGWEQRSLPPRKAVNSELSRFGSVDWRVLLWLRAVTGALQTNEVGHRRALQISTRRPSLRRVCMSKVILTQLNMSCARPYRSEVICVVPKSVTGILRSSEPLPAVPKNRQSYTFQLSSTQAPHKWEEARRLAVHLRIQRFPGGLAGAHNAELCRRTVRARRAFDLVGILGATLALVRVRTFREARREPLVEGAQDWLTILSSGADESARKVSPEMTTEQKETPFKMVAEEGVAEVNRLVPRLVEAVEMSQLEPTRFVAGSALQRARASCWRTRPTVHGGDCRGQCGRLSKRNLERLVSDHRCADHRCARSP